MTESLADQVSIIDGKSGQIDKLIQDVTDQELRDSLSQSLAETVEYLNKRCEEKQASFEDNLTQMQDLWTL